VVLFTAVFLHLSFSVFGVIKLFSILTCTLKTIINIQSAAVEQIKLY
jgi:hypothetical protein